VKRQYLAHIYFEYTLRVSIEQGKNIVIAILAIYQHILIAIDGSEYSKNAFNKAIRISKKQE